MRSLDKQKTNWFSYPGHSEGLYFYDEQFAKFMQAFDEIKWKFFTFLSICYFVMDDNSLTWLFWVFCFWCWHWWTSNCARVIEAHLLFDSEPVICMSEIFGLVGRKSCNRGKLNLQKLMQIDFILVAILMLRFQFQDVDVFLRACYAISVMAGLYNGCTTFAI